MKLTNLEIFNIANNLLANLQELDTHIPAKANFFMQKNIDKFVKAAQEIETSRIKVVEHYGEKQEDGNFNFTEETAAAANKELEELFSIEQDIKITKFSIDSLGQAEFTPAQMQALMIMIED